MQGVAKEFDTIEEDNSLVVEAYLMVQLVHKCPAVVLRNLVLVQLGCNL